MPDAKTVYSTGATQEDRKSPDIVAQFGLFNK